jgi:tetratricopeptide repeat protein 30
MYVEA